KAVPFFIYFLDAETPNFLVWYYKNFGKHSLELKKEMDGKFKSAFISMLNYVLLKARGFDVYYVSTWANPPEKNEADSQESSFFNLFADKKTSSKRVENSLCAVKISDKNFVFVDFLNHWISKKFSLEDVYDKKGEIYYEMKTSINRNDLYGHFQLSKGALVPSNVIVNLLLQMNRMGYQILQDDRSLKLARIKNPYNRNAYQLLAYISYWDNKFSEAINYFNKSLENYKNDPETYYLMGQFYNEAKDYPNSIDSINNALKLDPGLTEAKLLLAFNYQGFRDYGTALEIARDCLKDNSKDPSVHILLSQLYSSFGNISAAKKHAKEAIKFLKLQGNNERAAAVAAYLNSFDEKK
ncbi:MAG: hypothetical protein KKD07_06875, partial [Candidatus Omnitrophica bacterium]|nr:hypothetical protein [Candidatus Omnitrophota bacterium]